MRPTAWGLAALLALCGAGARAWAQAETPCAKADFEAVVNEAGAVLRDINRQNTPAFQAKLRELKDKRAWSDDQFMKEAEPFVRDQDIVAYDQKAEELLNRIASGGQQGASASGPDCAILAELRAAMKLLVETQKAKWAHMFTKISGELGK